MRADESRRGGYLIRHALATVMAAVFVATGCTTTSDTELADQARQQGTQPTGTVAVAERTERRDDGVLVEEQIDEDGGAVRAADVTVTVPESTSASSLLVRISNPPEGPGYQRWGSLVEIEHEGPLAKPVLVRWDVSHLTGSERNGLVVVRWHESAARWLAEDVAIEQDGAWATIEHAEWSTLSLTALSQDVRELLGRGVDPPSCSGDRPSWVQAFVDPAQNTGDAASLLACLEPDRDDPDVVTMRIANNRPYSQFVTVEAEDPLAEVWKGDASLDPTILLHRAIADVTDGPNRVLVPPLHEVTLGLARPSSPIRNQYIGLTSQITPQSVLIDVMGLAIGVLPLERAVMGDEMLLRFLQLAIGCGMDRVPDLLDLDGLDAATAAIGVIKDCVAELMDPTTRLYQDLLSSADSAEAIRANLSLQSLTGWFWALEVAEVAFYLAELSAELAVGGLTWSVNADGRPAEPGAWDPTCTDPEADRQAWNRSWVPNPAFYVGETRDYHEYPEFESILTEATAPLGRCSADHVRQIRALVEPTAERAPETFARILGIFDELLESLSDEPATSTTSAPEEASCDAASIVQAFGAEATALGPGCQDGWALIETCSSEPCGDDWILARIQEGQWSRVTGFPTASCRSDFEAMGAPGAVLDPVNWGPLCDGQTTTTAAETTTTSVSSTTDRNAVMELFIAAWNAGDWDLMATVADEGTVQLARQAAVPGGAVLPAPPRGRCIALYPDYHSCEIAYGTGGSSVLYSLRLADQVNTMTVSN